MLHPIFPDGNRNTERNNDSNGDLSFRGVRTIYSWMQDVQRSIFVNTDLFRKMF